MGSRTTSKYTRVSHFFSLNPPLELFLASLSDNSLPAHPSGKHSNISAFPTHNVRFNPKGRVLAVPDPKGCESGAQAAEQGREPWRQVQAKGHTT
jgi:hypothetical protein